MKFLEEYCLPSYEDPRYMTRYAGNRVLEELPPGRKPGAAQAEELKLPEDATIYRGFVRKPVVLKRGQRVKRWLTVLDT